ncbi:MAG: hypothetical protein J6C46_09115 [Clostridia bacterium]|nr:hypothetical protein [Clostridia bacterium]
MERIISNKIQCKHCGEIIESKHVHNFVTCKCETCAVDGGHWHLSRSFRNSPEEDYIELSETEEIDDDEFFKNS